MKNQPNTSLSHSFYLLNLHIVFVTKYRRTVLTANMLKYVENAFAEILADWRCRLLEFGGEDDLVHMLVDIHPHSISQPSETI